MTEQPTVNSNQHTSLTHWVWSWACALAGAEPTCSTRVRSGDANQVYHLEMGGKWLFLKVGPRLQPEHDRLIWLEGRLPAPRAIGFKSQSGADALLMSAVDGQDLATLSDSLTSQAVIERLAGALRVLHASPVTDWPFGGSGGLVHGDACLPNFLFVGDHLSGYIDVGDMALGNPKVDLAAAIWSLQYNMGVGHGLTFLREYGVIGVNEADVERLRMSYQHGSF